MIHPLLYIGLKPEIIPVYLLERGLGKKQYSYLSLEMYIETHYHHLLTEKRTRDLIVERHALMSIIRKHKDRFNNISLKRTGCLFENRDHSTVLHAMRNVKNWLEYPEVYDREMIVYALTEHEFLKHFK